MKGRGGRGDEMGGEGSIPPKVLLVLWHCWLGHISLTRKIVSEMTYIVSSGTLNPTIPYHTKVLLKWRHWVRHVHVFVATWSRYLVVGSVHSMWQSYDYANVTLVVGALATLVYFRLWRLYLRAVRFVVCSVRFAKLQVYDTERRTWQNYLIFASVV